MLDLKVIWEEPAPYRAALARRGSADALDRALRLDERRRSLLTEIEGLRADQRKYAKAIPRQPTSEDREEMIAASRVMSERINALEPDLIRVEDELADLMGRLPNVPDPSVPDGSSDEDNEVIRVVGDPPVLDFQPKDHGELGERLGMIDIERGVRTSGSRFYYLTGPAVRLEFALVQLGLDFAERHGLWPVWTPALARREAMFGTGFLPTDEAQIYATRDDDLYLIGTAEVTLASYHAGEILDPAELPKRYVGYSTCFRREAGTYGKDTRGVFRVHQFDKLEMFSFVLPEDSLAEHDRLLAREEEFVQALGLAYRVVNVCVGELGAPVAKKYDIEAWFPGQGRYREITSTSNTTDYQARRLETRVRLADGTRPLHTLNGTLCALTRMIACLIENGQQADGSVEMPEVLRPYLPEAHWVIRPPA
ncbi:MAG: serine--tRNA ligase [Actinomycetota bacterium]